MSRLARFRVQRYKKYFKKTHFGRILTRILGKYSTDAGSYTVSYYVQGDKNHNDTEVQTVACSIQKDQGTMEFETTSYQLIYVRRQEIL